MRIVDTRSLRKIHFCSAGLAHVACGDGGTTAIIDGATGYKGKYFN